MSRRMQRPLAGDHRVLTDDDNGTWSGSGRALGTRRSVAIVIIYLPTFDTVVEFFELQLTHAVAYAVVMLLNMLCT